MHRGGAQRHYSTLSLSDLKKFELPADENSVLLMWVTFPMLQEAFEVMKAWGFKYKTVAWVWVKGKEGGKLSMGMGHYTRSNAEMCLLGVKGKGVPRQCASILNVQTAPREQHSKKPDKFYELIETLFGDVSRIELFARQRREGWDAHGLEVENGVSLGVA